MIFLEFVFSPELLGSQDALPDTPPRDPVCLVDNIRSEDPIHTAGSNILEHPCATFQGIANYAGMGTERRTHLLRALVI